MKRKATRDRVVDKVKARVVAGGNQQDKSIYTLDETASPTVVINRSITLTWRSPEVE